ncbi:hypothetical protein EC844_12922 [Acinetobacter calcoaceticus]|uniref:Uncharacterized protein n=1 Tax=Acinetobacter calcoaceticus TaxID=471 RepID=A0A4R1XDX0_ACICA|nr:hypothetical protein EC844_12922 [Acinetobacter calcoaceticus]
MKYFNSDITLGEIIKFNEEENFTLWVHPKYVIGFDKDELLILNSEINYINNHYSSEDVVESPDIVVVDYLTSCLKFDQFNTENNNYFIKCFDMVNAAIYLIINLISSKTSYPFAWWGGYLINIENCNEVFNVIFKSFVETKSNHVKNLLRIFCIELLDNFLQNFHIKNQIRYKDIQQFETDTTYMY